MHWLRAIRAPGRSATPDAPSTSITGRRIGPYQLLSELGRGGMGSVWLARRDDGQYEGQVAIKLLAASWLGREGEQRFRQEGTVLARLDHPNIARLLDAGVAEPDQPYLVLEYVQGERIDEHCRRAGLDTRARVELFLELLSAVSHAHRNLIVHRDIKPANVLVTGEGKVKLLDFGISKLVDQGALLTRTGHIMLTPEYASPEQLLGEPVTTATDVYALGLLLYLLLTGRLPFSDGSPAELMRRVTTGAMPLPSSVATTRTAALTGESTLAQPRGQELVRRELRGDLDNIVLKAVHSAPEHRYQEVAAFAADLRRYLNHEPVSARAATLRYRVRKFVRRNRGGLAAAVLAVLAVAVGTTFGLSQWLEAGRQRDEARNQQSTATLISDVLNFALSSDGGPDRPRLSVAEHVARSADLLEQRYAHDPRFAAQLMTQLAETLLAAPESARQDLLRRAHDLGRRAGDREIMASALCNLARHETVSGMPRAAAHIQQAHRLMGQMERESSVRIECLLAESLIEAERGNRARAIPLVIEAADLLDRRGMPERETYVDVLSYLAGLYMEDSNLRAALEVTERTERLSAELGMADTSEHLTILQNHAVQLMAAGEVGRAWTVREQVNRMSRKFYTDDTIPVTYVRNQAMLLMRMDRTAEALALIEGQMARVRSANEPGYLLDFLQSKASVHAQLAQWDLAEQALTEAQSLLEQGAGPKQQQSSSEITWSDIALHRNDPAAARRHVETALALAGYGTSKRERSLKSVLWAATRVALATQQHAEAEKFATQALRISEQQARSADSSADVGQSLLLLVEATAGTAPLTTRRSMLERAVKCLSKGLRPDHRLTVEARRMLESLSISE